MQQSPLTMHIIRGLVHRDLVLLATACTNQANFLAQLAAGHYDDDTAIKSGYHRDRRGAIDDAQRLHHIADTLRDRASGTQKSTS